MILTTKSEARTKREELQIALPMTRPTIPPDKESSKEINGRKTCRQCFSHCCSSIKDPPERPLCGCRNVKSCCSSSLACSGLVKKLLSTPQRARTKTRGGVRSPCCSAAEVTEIRRGVAWRVNGKETLNRGSLVTHTETLKPWEVGTSALPRNTDCSGIPVRFQGATPPHDHHHHSTMPPTTRLQPHPL